MPMMPFMLVRTVLDFGLDWTRRISAKFTLCSNNSFGRGRRLLHFFRPIAEGLPARTLYEMGKDKKEKKEKKEKKAEVESQLDGAVTKVRQPH